MLTKVTVLVDASTTTGHQTGTQSSKAKMLSVVGRSVVGGVLTGGAGAIVGGVTAKRNATIDTETTQTLHTNLTVELQFREAAPIHVVVTELSSYHWLLEQSGSEPASDDELRQMQTAAQVQIPHELEEKRKWNYVDEQLNDQKPKLRTKRDVTLVFATAVIGAIFGLIDGDSLVTKILLATFFGILAFCILGIPLLVILAIREQEAEKEYERKRKKLYEELYP